VHQVREVWLSSEDTGAYGRDIGSSIAELLQRCVAVLPPDGRTMLRLGMTNPPFILEHLDAVAEVIIVFPVMLCIMRWFSLCQGYFVVELREGHVHVELQARQQQGADRWQHIVTAL
jgi:hypothetical protein